MAQCEKKKIKMVQKSLEEECDRMNEAMNLGGR